MHDGFTQIPDEDERGKLLVPGLMGQIHINFFQPTSHWVTYSPPSGGLFFAQENVNFCYLVEQSFALLLYYRVSFSQYDGIRWATNSHWLHQLGSITKKYASFCSRRAIYYNLGPNWYDV